MFQKQIKPSERLRPNTSEMIRKKYANYLGKVLKDELPIDKFQEMVRIGVHIALNVPEHPDHYKYWKTFIDLGLANAKANNENNIEITINDLRENANFQQAILGIKPITVEVIDSEIIENVPAFSTGLHQSTVRELPVEVPTGHPSGSVEVSDNREVPPSGDNVVAGTGSDVETGVRDETA